MVMVEKIVVPFAMIAVMGFIAYNVFKELGGCKVDWVQKYWDLKAYLSKFKKKPEEKEEEEKESEYDESFEVDGVEDE